MGSYWGDDNERDGLDGCRATLVALLITGVLLLAIGVALA